MSFGREFTGFKLGFKVRLVTSRVDWWGHDRALLVGLWLY